MPCRRTGQTWVHESEEHACTDFRSRFRSQTHAPQSCTYCANKTSVANFITEEAASLVLGVRGVDRLHLVKPKLEVPF